MGDIEDNIEDNIIDMSNIIEIDNMKNMVEMKNMIEMSNIVEVDTMKNHKELLSMYNNIIRRKYYNFIHGDGEGDGEGEVDGECYGDGNKFINDSTIENTINLIYSEACSNNINIEEIKDEVELIKNQLVDLHSDVELIKNKLDELISIITNKN
jgi:hypothetical protein